MRNTKYGYVYMTTNIINGRKYIGQHKHNYNDKWYKGSNKKLREDVKKFGSKNFTVEILEYCDSKEQLNKSEKFWIDYFNAENDVNFYNIYGGGYPDHIPEESKEKIRKKKLEINKTKGKSFWVNNGTSESLICEAQREEYYNNGYVKGRLPDTVYMNKDGKSIRVKKHQVYDYIKEGYSLGKDETILNNNSISHQHHIWYYGSMEFASSRELTEYLRSNGYPDITYSTVTGIARGHKYEKYSELSERIRKIKKE